MRREVTIGILLIITSALTEAHSLYYHWWPEDAAAAAYYIKGDPTRPVNREWFLIFTCDALYKLSICAAAAFAIMQPSHKLTLVFCLHVGYNLIDYVLLMANNREGNGIYYLLCFVLIITTGIICFTPKRNKNKIVQL